MVHGIMLSSSDVLASLLALEFDVGDWPWIDNAFKPMESLYHVKYILLFSLREGQHKRLMKILAAVSDEDKVRILHAESNCGPLLSDMNVKRAGLLFLLWSWSWW